MEADPHSTGDTPSAEHELEYSEILEMDVGEPTGHSDILPDKSPVDIGFGETTIHVELENIGGISEQIADIDPGVTLLVGENATNRTSIIKGIGAALGADTGSLKADADTGQARLTIDATTFQTTFNRRSDTVVTDHDGPWDMSVERRAAITNFVLLTETNPLRRAVRMGNDLHSLIMAPVDTNDIEQRLDAYQRRRSQIADRIAEIEQEKQRLTSLEEERESVRTELDTVRKDLEAVEEEIKSYELDREEAQQQNELMQQYEELLATRERLKQDIDRQQQALERTKEKHTAKKTELSELTVSVEDEYDEIETVRTELQQLQDRRSDIQDVTSKLNRLIRTTREMLEADVDVLKQFNTDDDPTAELNPADEDIRCWTCGSTVERNVIEDWQEQIKAIKRRKNEREQELDKQIEELRMIERRYERSADRRQQLKIELDNLETEIEDIELTITNLTEQLETTNEEIETLETEIENAQTDGEIDALMTTYQERGNLQSRRSRLEDQLDNLDDKINEIEEQVDRLDDLEATNEQLNSAIEELRGEIKRTETTVIEEFNERMADVLELLEYGNLERIWIERKLDNDSTSFDLHIVRTAENGSVYEDTIDHLSESEREVVTLVVTIAGYLAHDIDEFIPILLLDSIEAIDVGRIKRLLSYFAAETEYLVAALLEGDAEPLPDAYTRIRPGTAD